MKRVNKSINTEVNAYYVHTSDWYLFLLQLYHMCERWLYNTGFEYFVHFVPIHSMQSARPAGGHITVFCLLIGKINKISANLIFFLSNTIQHSPEPNSLNATCIPKYNHMFLRFFFDYQNVENWLACRFFSLTSFFSHRFKMVKLLKNFYIVS